MTKSFYKPGNQNGYIDLINPNTSHLYIDSTFPFSLSTQHISNTFPHANINSLELGPVKSPVITLFIEVAV